MEYISSDTNVWIDFKAISRLDLPFLLPYTYIMYEESMQSELLSPAGFYQELTEAGLIGIDITYDEFFLAESWGEKYPRLSVQDRIALAIAKSRRIFLLTGDGALRKAAHREGVNVIGTLGILDKLYNDLYISPEIYRDCLQGLQNHNGVDVRLPQDELARRLNSLEG